MARITRRFALGALALGALGLAAYAAAGFWLAPRIIRAQATDYVRQELGKQLTLGEIRTNPFTFELEVKDLAIGDGKSPMVSLRRGYADAQLSSLWSKAWTLRALTLEAPFARAIVRPDGSLNLSELVPKDKDKDDSPPPEVFIADLQVTQGVVNFSDQSRRLRPEKVLSPIAFSLRAFHTSAEGGGFSFSAASSQGERFDWRGRLSLRPVASEGQFKVTALRARSAYEFISEQLPFEISQGQVDLAGRYHFALGDEKGPRLDLGVPEIAIRDLGLRPIGGDRDWLTLPAAKIAKLDLSLQQRKLSLGSVNLQGLSADAWRDAGGGFNLQALFAPKTAAAKAVDHDAAATAWNFSMGPLSLREGRLSFEDRSVTPVARYAFTPLSLDIPSLGRDSNQALPLSLDTVINGQAPLSLKGELTPATGATRLDLSLAKLPLRDLLSYLPQYPALEFRSGVLEARGELRLAGSAANAPQLAFDGTGSVDGFQLLQGADKHPLLAWKRMGLEGLKLEVAPTRIELERMRLQGLFAQVEVASDGRLNLVTALAPAARKPTSAPAPAAASAPLPLHIADVQLDAGTMSFADYSIEPNFSARIEALHGRIGNVSSDSQAVTHIHLDGQVLNRYSPVSIQGETRPFAFDKHTDVTMKFSNIELPIFNPYSGRFAGYSIAKGKLSTELHYQIKDRKLVAAHHVVLDQLEWGAATDSKDKVSLPIRLATSLLKDSHGVIDLDLPVTGSLDDPKFRVGPIVWQIIGNLIVKVATAPFRFIGSLFKGAEDAQYVDFAPGSAQLSDAAKTSLAALAKGLADRAELKIDIPVGHAGELDASAMADARLRAAALALKPAVGDYASLEADDKYDRLRALYKAGFGKKPEFPEAEASADEATRKQRKLASQQADIVWLEAQLKPRYQPDANALAELAQARAQSVQEALLAGGELDASRVFLAGNQALLAKEGKARMELGLK